ncbi:MAG TPA: DUF3592 domain-containing protein, partial [Lacipirellulaceae bacterium]|nr:DUF3592 domain-containing protein [Lacipirellulaceae bacterium]
MARPASPHDPAAASGTSRAASAAGLGCLILFALPFAATGVGAGGMAAVDVWRWAAVQQWVETPARLLESKLHTHRSSDGATYRVAAKYEYDFGGRPYVSERVAVQTGGDNLGNYHHDAARRLDAVRKAGGATVCYVNPRDPQQAVLFRTLRLGLLCFKLAFALLFGGVGFGLIAAAFFGRRKLRREAELQAAVPLEPWRWRDEWADGRIRSMTGLQAKVAAGFAVAWNLISWPSFIGAAVSRDVGWGALAAIGLFPLVGTGFAIWAGRLWLVRRRWGVSELELTTLPGVLGGPLAGIIRVPCPLAAPRDVELNLACIRSERRTSGGKSTREDVTIWDDDVAVAGR